MSLSEFYKCQYELEITRKTDLTAALSIPVGVLSLLVGALVLMAKDLHAPLSGWDKWTLAAIGSSAFACLVAGYYLFRAHSGLSYEFLPNASAMQTHFHELVAFHETSGRSKPDAAAEAERETLTYIDDQHARNAALNNETNHVKSGHLHRGNLALMVAVAIAVVAGTLYVINSVSTATAVQHVEVVNIKEAPSNGISSPAKRSEPLAGSSSPADPAAKPVDQGRLSPPAKPAAAASEVKPASAAASTAKP